MRGNRRVDEAGWPRRTANPRPPGRSPRGALAVLGGLWPAWFYGETLLWLGGTDYLRLGLGLVGAALALGGGVALMLRTRIGQLAVVTGAFVLFVVKGVLELVEYGDVDPLGLIMALPLLLGAVVALLPTVQRAVRATAVEAEFAHDRY